jgi:ubiquinone/menaquinone biosynthesis C-methylase UbiE
MQDAQPEPIRQEEETDWKQQEQEWSSWWGDAVNKWSVTVYPRIRHFLPAHTILELAPGHGRWSHFLKDLCSKLYLVDVTPHCIERCRQRFLGANHIEYHVNDGFSLEMIPSRSIDLFFSFDSLMLADVNVIRSYVSQLDRVLANQGTALIHHSNAKVYRRYFHTLDLLPAEVTRSLQRHGLIQNRGMRSIDVSGDDVLKMCHSFNLDVLLQERIPWGGTFLIDCITVVRRQQARFACRMPKIISNREFMREAAIGKSVLDSYQGARSA